jgi:predicted hotdog family 3-hydroxylacyl-ACP dehydratase
MASFEKVNIPQKPPMVMVDRLVEVTENTTVTAFLIPADNVFCANGEFREPGLIENMAQTAAAGAGARPENADGPAQTGFIGGIRNLKIVGFPKAGQEILTRITVLHKVFDASIVQGEVYLNDQFIAGCELKIFLISK